MSVKVHSALMDGIDIYRPLAKNPGVFVHDSDTCLRGVLTWRGKKYKYAFHRMAGYKGDFGSTPDIKVAQAVVPSKVVFDDVYNAALDAHDWLYSVKGELTVPLAAWTRLECNDFMRGVMRESPYLKAKRGWIARFCAGCADFFTKLFAGGKNHWGNDSYESMNKAEMILTEVK